MPFRRFPPSRKPASSKGEKANPKACLQHLENIRTLAALNPFCILKTKCVMLSTEQIMITLNQCVLVMIIRTSMGFLKKLKCVHTCHDGVLIESAPIHNLLNKD